MLFSLEMAGQRLATGGLCLLLRWRLGGVLRRRLGTLLERAALITFDDGRRRRERRSRRGRLALFALRYGQQLGDAVVEARKLLDELAILLNDPGHLIAKRGILFSQRFQLVHRRVQITFGDLCRSSSLLFLAETADTSRAARR